MRQCAGDTWGDSKAFAGTRNKWIGNTGRISRKEWGSMRRRLLGGNGKIRCCQLGQAVDGTRGLKQFLEALHCTPSRVILSQLTDAEVPP